MAIKNDVEVFCGFMVHLRAANCPAIRAKRIAFCGFVWEVDRDLSGAEPQRTVAAALSIFGWDFGVGRGFVG